CRDRRLGCGQCRPACRLDPRNHPPGSSRPAAAVPRHARGRCPLGVAPVTIGPGSTIGILGGGQLGRLFSMSARRLGYRVHTLAPEYDTPTGQIADVEVNASYDDVDAVRAFASAVDVVTFEFENVSAAAAAAAEAVAIVRPNGRSLAVAQHRIRE